MIKKLRIKLIVASMISLFLVLFIIGGIAGVLNYRKIAEDADRILEVLEKNAGHFQSGFSIFFIRRICWCWECLGY